MPISAVGNAGRPRPAGAAATCTRLEWRHVTGDWADAGPATIWGRMRYLLLPDEEPTGLQRVMVVAGSGNGVSSVLPLDRCLFINMDLTVHLEAIPSGEWICLDARTRIDQLGSGSRHRSCSTESASWATVPRRSTSQPDDHQGAILFSHGPSR